MDSLEQRVIELLWKEKVSLSFTYELVLFEIYNVVVGKDDIKKIFNEFIIKYNEISWSTL